MKKLLFSLVFCLILVNFVSAQPEFIIQQSEDYDLVIGCGDGFCPSGLESNFTLQNPNSTIIIDNKKMTVNKANVNFTIPGNKLSKLGDYQAIISSLDTSEGLNDTQAFVIRVTPTGKDFDQAEGTTSIGILFSVIAISIIFIVLSFKLFSKPSTSPLGLFFALFSIILIIYSLFLGFSFANDITEYSVLTGSQQTIFIAVLWSMVILGIVSGAFMMVAFIRELGMVLKKKSFGSNFDPISNTYE